MGASYPIYIEVESLTVFLCDLLQVHNKEITSYIYRNKYNLLDATSL